MSLHRQMGSDRDLQSSASSVSLPSVKKAPKKRRISIGSLFRRKKENKRKSRELNGGVDGIASIESIHSEMCTDKNSIFSTNTSSDNGLTSISKQIGDFIECPLCLLRHSKDRFPESRLDHSRLCRHADHLRSCPPYESLLVPLLGHLAWGPYTGCIHSSKRSSCSHTWD